MSVNKEDIEEFCEEFQYPFIILYGLEKAFLGVAEFYNDHKLLLYDKEMIFHCFTDQGYPIDIIEKKFNKFFEFWRELQSNPDGVFSGQTEDPYRLLRARLPQEITDDVVRLIAYNEEAFKDFAEIESQSDVMDFNRKYGVELVLPTDDMA